MCISDMQINAARCSRNLISSSVVGGKRGNTEFLFSIVFQVLCGEECVYRRETERDAMRQKLKCLEFCNLGNVFISPGIQEGRVIYGFTKQQLKYNLRGQK